jgi:hypothetical protein
MTFGYWVQTLNRYRQRRRYNDEAERRQLHCLTPRQS